MDRRPVDRRAVAVELACLALAAWLVGLLAVVWAGRLSYPYDLEWMEGGMLAHAWRLGEGLPLYVAPDPDFVPFVYPPGYAALLALLGEVFGLGPTLGRLLALSGVFSACGAMAFGLWRQTGDRFAAVAAVAVFLGTYPASGAFFDLTRPDGPFVGTLAWALVIGAERRKGAEVAAGLMLAASFTMKHNAAAFGVPIALGIWARDDWRTAVRFGLAAALPALGFTVYMQLISDGRFLQYLLDVPGSHPRIFARVMPGMPREVGTAMPLVAALPAVWAIFRLETWAPRLPRPLAVVAPVVAGIGFGWVTAEWGEFGPDALPVPSSFAAFGVGAGAAVLLLRLGDLATGAARGRSEALSWRWVYAGTSLAVGLGVASLMRAHNGGFLNVYMHLHWLLVAAFGAVVAELRRSRPGASVAGAAVALQLAWMIGRVDRAGLVPTAEDREVGDALVAAIGAYEGPVLSPYASWLPVYAGKAPSLHLMALWDLDYEGGPFFAEVEVVRAAIRQKRWSAAIDGQRPFGYGLQQHYEEKREIGVGEGLFRPRTGWAVKPSKVLEPIR